MANTYFKSTLAAAFACVLSLGAAEPKLTSIEVFPPDVCLDTSRDLQSIVVQASYSDGTNRDVASQAKYTFANPALVRRDKSVLYPQADGKTDLTVEFGGQKVVLPVEVKNATTDRPISFKLDIMPVITRAGCNTGSCHGAARGKDGFRLSLFGFDPDGDYFRITREILGRRVNLAVPAESMFVEKAAGQVPHTGGERVAPKGELYNNIVRWIEAGALNDDDAKIAHPVSIDVYPLEMVLETGATQAMTVRAKYSDGTDRDVTKLSVFFSSNDSTAAVTPEGVVTAGTRGEAFVMARFHTFTIGSPSIVIPKGAQPPPSYPKPNNYIDDLVNAKLHKLRIEPSGICSDEVYLRRVYVDIVGMLPTREEYEQFVADSDPKKREKLVDDLLDRKEFAEIWTMKFAELLRMRTYNNIPYKAVMLYYNWLQNRIANNVPMDKIVTELLSAQGGTFGNPATNLYEMERETKKLSEDVAQVFMGMRLQCAQCHNHPFDRWTMDDYYSFAAFFAQIGRKRGEDPRETVVFNSRGGDVRHLVTNKPMAPKFLGGAVPEVAGKDRRLVLAEWLVSPENSFFARNLSNMIWAHFFGKGIIEPVDDVRISNPPSNEQLLDALAKHFVEYKYDFKRLIRDICTSRTYQLSTQTNPTNELDTRNFSHGAIRRIRAEVMLDVISQVTDTQDKFNNLPKGARAVQIVDGRYNNYFLTTFGRATRDTVCSCEVKMDPNLSQALHLLNGQTTTGKINEGKVVKLAVKGKKPTNAIIEDLYIRCLSRKPTAKEIANFETMLKDEKDPTATIEDVFWALLNSKEFIFNH